MPTLTATDRLGSTDRARLVVGKRLVFSDTLSLADGLALPGFGFPESLVMADAFTVGSGYCEQLTQSDAFRLSLGMAIAEALAQNDSAALLLTDTAGNYGFLFADGLTMGDGVSLPACFADSLSLSDAVSLLTSTTSAVSTGARPSRSNFNSSNPAGPNLCTVNVSDPYPDPNHPEALVRDVSISALLSASVPATSSSAGTPGQTAYDGSYFYVCVALNTWRRVALSSW